MNNLEVQSLSSEHLLHSLPIFMKKIDGLIHELGIELDDYQADHIAVRINDFNTAKESHQQWLSFAKEWSSAMINGRPIIVLGFDEPIKAGKWSVECLELPYPGEKLYEQQGWEHIEWVIPSTAVTVETFLDDVLTVFPKLEEQWSELEKKGIKVKLSSPQGENERLSNPTIAFKKNGVCIKLHPHALKRVIESEQQ